MAAYTAWWSCAVLSCIVVTAAQHKVLLIDDSEISLHFVAGVLLRAGYDVRTADDVDKL